MGQLFATPRARPLPPETIALAPAVERYIPPFYVFVLASDAQSTYALLQILEWTRVSLFRIGEIHKPLGRETVRISLIRTSPASEAEFARYFGADAARNHHWEPRWDVPPPPCYSPPIHRYADGIK